MARVSRMDVWSEGRMILAALSAAAFVAIAARSTTQLHSCGHKVIYFDNNASTKPFRCVQRAVARASQEHYANASSQHGEGARSGRLLDECRADVAALLGCSSGEVYFTSGSTESNNLVVRGVAARYAGTTLCVYATPVEHASVSRTCDALKPSVHPDCHVNEMKVDARGSVDVADLERRLRALRRSSPGCCILLSVVLANNEIGTIQDVAGIVHVARAVGAIVHADATQVVGRYHLDLGALGVDTASFSSHKFHGPKGVGGLYVRADARRHITSCVTGGSQERTLRAGTENLPGIFGMAVALQQCMELLQLGEASRVAAMCMYLFKHIPRVTPCRFNGPPPGAKNTLYNTLSVTFENFSAKYLMRCLMNHGICVSAGSACSKGAGSATLHAVGLHQHEIEKTLRISLSFANTIHECQAFVQALQMVCSVM